MDLPRQLSSEARAVRFAGPLRVGAPRSAAVALVQLAIHPPRTERFPPPRLAPPACGPVALGSMPPAVFAAPLPLPRLRIVGGVLPEGIEARCSGPPGGPARRRSDARATMAAPRAATSVTRIRPPRDVVKLEERLLYLLQPPLENLLAAESLSFARQPFPFQLDGVAYLYPRHEAVLADEMGLGKTMQAIIALRLLAHEGRVRRALVVCPKPLVTNWRRELTEWAPELPVTIVEGGQAQRTWMWQHAASGVLVANYESLVRDRQFVSDAAAPFDLVIVDEAQRIKNNNSATHEAVCAAPRRRSWALTGTPIENSADDLVGIFEFVSPGRLRAQMKPAAIRQAVGDHVLRRTKDQVLTELPPKTLRDLELTLTAEQAEAYRRAEDEGVVRLNHLGGELTIRHVIELVLRLKQICNFDPATGASAKLDCLEAELEECAASGRKAIVFSQWVRTIERLRPRLSRFGALEFHGRVPAGRRDGVLQQFRDDRASQVLLMSYGAGSVGLNLQFAGYVFLFDRWWNPAVEDQAVNRAHRIGAAGPVTVTRFLTAGTIEERINAVLQEKRELFSAVFDASLMPGKRGLSRDEIFGLFNLRFPEDQVAA
ncbi:MAG TPA: SNF2-related protein [Lacipirellulaceae bacterium]|nr:SNF2-related protein [Lacipirellulaceae bacterium]